MSRYLPWKSFESEVCQFFKRLGFNAKRNWAEQFNQKSGVDIYAVGKNKSFAIQCKYSKVEMPKLVQAWNEILNGKKDKEIPVVVVRGQMKISKVDTSTQSLVLLSWADFKRLITVSTEVEG